MDQLNWTAMGLVFEFLGVSILIIPTACLVLRAYIFKDKKSLNIIEDEAMAAAFNRLAGEGEESKKDPVYLGIILRMKLTPVALIVILLGFIFQFLGSF